MIVLIGFMGAGKTTTGRALALLLGVPWIDTDVEIEERYGRSIARIFAEDGEDAFRSLERDVALEVLAGADGVVSLGGGAVGDPDIQNALAGHSVIHLTVPLDEALARIDGGVTRPLLFAHDPAELAEERAPLYRALASIEVDTSRKTPREVAEEIRSLVAIEGRSA